MPSLPAGGGAGGAPPAAPAARVVEGSIKLAPLAKLKTVSCDTMLFGSNKATRLSDHFGVEATFSVPKALS